MLRQLTTPLTLLSPLMTGSWEKSFAIISVTASVIAESGCSDTGVRLAAASLLTRNVGSPKAVLLTMALPGLEWVPEGA
jgi:hypothetical protein